MKTTPEPFRFIGTYTVWLNNEPDGLLLFEKIEVKCNAVTVEEGSIILTEDKTMFVCSSRKGRKFSFFATDVYKINDAQGQELWRTKSK
jgi:hypothetical protein